MTRIKGVERCGAQTSGDANAELSGFGIWQLHRLMLTGAGSLCLVLYSDLTMATTCPPRSTLTSDPWQRVSKAEVSATQGLRSDCDLKTERKTKVFFCSNNPQFESY